MAEPAAVVFLDFDGTITCRDATDAILDAFADPAWLEVEDAWLSGRIGSRECLAAQMALVTATPAEIDRLLDTIEVDPGFTHLLDVCSAHAVPVHILSDGFDYCIERILGRPDLNLLARLIGSRIVSSRLRPDGARWRATFPHAPQSCTHGCATCKPAAIEILKPAGAVTLFVGDGISDRDAASAADLVFAKDKLAAFCDAANLAYTPFDTLSMVARDVERLQATGPPLSRSFSRKVIRAV